MLAQLYFQGVLFPKLTRKLPSHELLLEILEDPHFLGTLGFL